MSDKLEEIEKAEGFDRLMAEAHITEYLGDRVLSCNVFDSNAPGVIAFERLSYEDLKDVRWTELADRLEKAIGVKVVCIANCDWSFDDRCDEEATYVAFDIPSLDRDYDSPYRNELTKERAAIAAPSI